MKNSGQYFTELTKAIAKKLPERAEALAKQIGEKEAVPTKVQMQAYKELTDADFQRLTQQYGEYEVANYILEMRQRERRSNAS